jgi:hypothetical protein
MTILMPPRLSTASLFFFPFLVTFFCQSFASNGLVGKLIELSSGDDSNSQAVIADCLLSFTQPAALRVIFGPSTLPLEARRVSQAHLLEVCGDHFGRRVLVLQKLCV